MLWNIRFDRLHKLASYLMQAGMAGLICLGQAQAQVNGKPPQSLQFADTTYQLSLQSHPMPGYSQYAYLSKGDKLPYYRNILMLEWLVNGVSVEEAVESQIDMLEQRKEDGDLTVNHRLIRNETTGEYLLDFVLSSEDPDVGNIVEWNAYRYVSFTDAHGEDGVQIYGYSARGYGDDGGREFLLDLREKRVSIIQSLASAKIPQLNRR